MTDYLLVERSGALARYEGGQTVWEKLVARQDDLPICTRLAFFSDYTEWVPNSLKENAFSRGAPGGQNYLARALNEVFAKVVARGAPAKITALLYSAPMDPEVVHQQIEHLISGDQMPDGVQTTLHLIHLGEDPALERFLKVVDSRVEIEEF